MSNTRWYSNSSFISLIYTSDTYYIQGTSLATGTGPGNAEVTGATEAAQVNEVAAAAIETCAAYAVSAAPVACHTVAPADSAAKEVP